MRDWRESLFPSLIFFTILSPIFLLLPLVALSNPQGVLCEVRRVIDGETLLLTNGQKVRLIGVDTPELDRAFARALVEKRRVRLEFDPRNVYINHRDRCGSVLAYVYVSRGNLGKEALQKYGYKTRAPAVFMLNAEIIRQGYGFASTRFPFRYKEEFRHYEKEARENGRGLWKSKAHSQKS